MKVHRYYNLALLTIAVVATVYRSAAAVGPRGVFRDAVGMWHMRTPDDVAGDNSSLRPIGRQVEFDVKLSGVDREASLARGGDGFAVRLRDSSLVVGQGANGEINLGGHALTMLIRFRNDGPDWNTTLFSKHGGHNVLQYNIYCFETSSGELDLGTEVGTDRGFARTRTLVGKFRQPGWHDVVVRYAGDRVELFLDGRNVGGVAHSGELRPANEVPLVIAGEPTYGDVLRRFTGLVDHAALWNRALTDEEIRRISSAAPSQPYRERFRPRIHFSPEQNWMNDPNGLVHLDGEYHLFYQYNPFGNSWGHMSWGHAVSPDLLHWKHLPVVLPEENGLMSFSGSAVVDADNTSGFGQDGRGPLVAIYTAHDGARRLQTQCIAYSTDRGRTFTKFTGNPVIDLNQQDFRDPKVFWYAPDSRWVMIVALSNERKVLFFGSRDLQKWERLGEFGPAGASPVANWECPDLFELPVDGNTDESKWVLEVDVGGGAPNGGSAGQYFVGRFDGKTFHNDNPSDTALWIDHGRDCYATQSYSNIPARDGRHIWMSWMNGMPYAGDIPTFPWRGAMTMPRELSLVRTGHGIRLRQQPIRELKMLRKAPIRSDISRLVSGRTVWKEASGNAGAMEIEVAFKHKTARRFGINIFECEDSATVIGYDTQKSELFVDRRRSGLVGFNDHFAGVHTAPMPLGDDNTVRLHLIIDGSSVEVFANDGETVMTERVFPDPDCCGVSLISEGGETDLEELVCYPLDSIWSGQRLPATD